MKFNVLIALLGASTAIKVNQRASTNAGRVEPMTEAQAKSASSGASTICGEGTTASPLHTCKPGETPIVYTPPTHEEMVKNYATSFYFNPRCDKNNDHFITDTEMWNCSYKNVNIQRDGESRWSM